MDRDRRSRKKKDRCPSLFISHVFNIIQYFIQYVIQYIIQYIIYVYNISYNIIQYYEFHFLCVTIDNRLTWKLHITILASRLSIIQAVIYKLRNKIDKYSLILLYNSLLTSRLTYFAASWRSNYIHRYILYTYFFNKIIILQNKVLQCIYKLPMVVYH